MKVNDMLGLGKVLPMEKLIEIVSSSVGKLSKSYFDRRDVDTKVYEIKKLAEARAEEVKIMSKAVKENFGLTGGIEYREEKISISSPKELPVQDQKMIHDLSIKERMQNRLEFQETVRQLNVENVTSFAANELKDEPPVTNEPLDDDWKARFFKIAEDVSHEEMQALWGKILAGEIKQPKSYSLRTLELIRNLSKTEADTFIKVANFSIKSGNGSYIFKGNDDDKLSSEYNISYMDIALLKEIGLIQPGDFVNHQFLQQETDNQRALIAGSIVIFINIKANTPTVAMPVDVFSNSGNELLKLIKPIHSFDYLKYLANSIRNQNVEVKYANILAWEGDNIRYSKPILDF